MVFLPAVRAAQAESDLARSGSVYNNAGDGPGPSSVSSPRFATPMAPPTVPVIRKQNIACDACRSRKIRCQRMTVDQICEQCQGRGSECTSNYVLQLAASKNQKRPGAKRRRKSDNEGEGEILAPRPVDPQPGLERNHSGVSSIQETPPSRPGIEPSRSSSSLSRAGSAPSAGQSRTASSRQHDLLRYLFAPEAITHYHFEYNDLSSLKQCDAGESDLWEEMGGEVWREAPSADHAAIQDDTLIDLADELLDSFFQITHIRYPLLDQDQFRAQFNDPDIHPDGALYQPLLAVAIAWGARFSESNILVADREEMTARDQKGVSRCRIVQLLVIRAREVGEVWKAFRSPKMDNVLLGILMEPLLAQAPFLKDRYQSTCITYATRHLSALGLESSSGVMGMTDEKKKMEAISARWLLSLSDGFKSAFNRSQPTIYDADFDLDHPPPTPPSQYSEAWYAASLAGSTLSASLSAQLFTRKVKQNGIPLPCLVKLARALSSWRDNHLSKLGVPSKWPEDWDFLAAITACSTDVYYHCLWLVVTRAIDDFGIIESVNMEEGKGMKERYKTESDHGAMRIAALAAVLTENGYLRLDPFIIYHPIYEAGLYLAKQGKEECLICVAGLKQYSITFPSVWALAEEIETVFASTIAIRNTTDAPQAPSHVLPPSASGSVEPVNSSGPVGLAMNPVDQQAVHSQNMNSVNQQAVHSQNTNSVDQQAVDTQNMSWPTKPAEGLAMPNPIAPTLGNAGANRDFWPDGTPVPSRDVAWNLFDWMHQT